MNRKNSEFENRGPAAPAGSRPRRPGMMREGGRSCDGTPPRRAIRPVVLGIGLACAALGGGCVHAPRQASVPAPGSPATAPQVAGGADTPTVSVDLNRTAGESTVFRETATDRQKFQVHIDFGKVFESQGDPDRALQEYQDALKVAEGRRRGELSGADEALAHRRIAAVFDRQGQFRQSEPHYLRAQKLTPRDPKVWNDAGYSYYLQGRWAEAERSLRTALKLAPDDARVRTNLGMTLAAAGKSEEALPHLSSNQGDAIGHANLGYLLASTGQYARARQEYEAALSMRPDLTLARRAMAQLDRQERGIATTPPTLIARGPAMIPPPADPQVRPASAEATTKILMPPLPPPLPEATPRLPSRSLPSGRGVDSR
jgi:Tfp pilus assembly protein PilF